MELSSLDLIMSVHHLYPFLNWYLKILPQVIVATGYRKSFPFLTDYHNGWVILHSAIDRSS